MKCVRPYKSNLGVFSCRLDLVKLIRHSGVLGYLCVRVDPYFVFRSQGRSVYDSDGAFRGSLSLSAIANGCITHYESISEGR